MVGVWNPSLPLHTWRRKTENTELRTSIVVFPMRAITFFAKQSVAIQILTDDRLLLSLAAGWNEMDIHSVRADFKLRGQDYGEEVRLFQWLMKDNTQFKGDSHIIKDVVFEPLTRRKIPLFFAAVEN